MRNNDCGKIVRDGNGIPLGALVLIRVPRSHRKLDRFISRLGYKPQFLYSFRFGGNFVYVRGDEYNRVKELVTRARVDVTQLLQCWGGSDA